MGSCVRRGASRAWVAAHGRAAGLCLMAHASHRQTSWPMAPRTRPARQPAALCPPGCALAAVLIYHAVVKGCLGEDVEEEAGGEPGPAHAPHGPNGANDATPRASPVAGDSKRQRSTSLFGLFGGERRLRHEARGRTLCSAVLAGSRAASSLGGAVGGPRAATLPGVRHGRRGDGMCLMHGCVPCGCVAGSMSAGVAQLHEKASGADLSALYRSGRGAPQPWDSAMGLRDSHTLGSIDLRRRPAVRRSQECRGFLPRPDRSPSSCMCRTGCTARCFVGRTMRTTRRSARRLLGC
jgi:hypothetical protein